MEVTDETRRALKRESHRRAKAKWRKKNAERVKAYQAEWHRNNKVNYRLKRYGLSPEAFTALLKAQGNRCAVCAVELDGGKGTHTDHCHTTGVVRGLLCGPCNMALGLLKEDVQRITALAAYARRHS